MTAISTRAISRSTCAPEPPLVQPDNQSLLLSARSPDSIQRYAPPARSGSSAPPPPSAAGAPFPSPTTSRYSGACAISPPRAPGAPRSASALPSNIASPTMPRSRVVSLAIAACARTSSIPGATPPFSTSKCSTLAEPRDYAGFKPFGALASSRRVAVSFEIWDDFTDSAHRSSARTWDGWDRPSRLRLAWSPSRAVPLAPAGALASSAQIPSRAVGPPAGEPRANRGGREPSASLLVLPPPLPRFLAHVVSSAVALRARPALCAPSLLDLPAVESVGFVL